MKFNYPHHVMLIAGLLGVSVLANASEELAPRIPEKHKEGKLVVQEKAGPSAQKQREQVLVPALRGMVFVGSIDHINRAGRSGVEGIQIEKLDVDSKGLQEVLHNYLNKPVTLALLDKINRDVVRFFRERDYTVVDSVVPSNQDITNGVVQFVVLFGKLGQVHVEGNEYFSDEIVREKFTSETDEVLRTSKLVRDLDWSNNNPFRSVNLLLAPGQSSSETDVILKVKDRKPLRFYAGLEDTGTDVVGEDRWLVGVNWGNAFGLDHQLNYQYVSSVKNNLLKAHALSYVIPLPWQHTLSLSASRSKTNANIKLPGFNQDGSSSEWNVRYNIPLPAKSNLRSDIELGYDFKRTDNNLQFGQVSVFNGNTDISQFSLAFHTRYSTSNAINTLSATLFYSPGDATGDNDDTAFNASRALATAEYNYFKVEAARNTRFDNGMEWHLNAQLQATTSNLLSSEQMELGGYRTVRGYDEYEALGDKGLFIRNEIYSKPYKVLSRENGITSSDEMRLLAFLEGGVVTSAKKLPGESVNNLWSTGVGLRYRIQDNLTLRADYGWQLNEVGNKGRDSRLHFGLMVSF